MPFPVDNFFGGTPVEPGIPGSTNHQNGSNIKLRKTKEFGSFVSCVTPGRPQHHGGDCGSMILGASELEEFFNPTNS